MEIFTVENNKASSVKVNDYPDECPVCHHNIKPIPIFYSRNNYKAAALFECPNTKCNNYFITYYHQKFHGKSFPYWYDASPIPGTIVSISPYFVQMYNEAQYAKAIGLDNIFGIGLRKALEFLIKDYIIYTKSATEEEIKSKFLGFCIKNYIDSEKIKDCASRAVWLGNDEVHYERIWINKDADDLDTLIKLTMAWIDHSEITEQFKNEMKKH
jgi:hypothetical protein